MTRQKTLLLFLVIGVATVVTVSLVRSSVTASPQPTVASQKWEYCAITWVPSAGAPGGGIRYYANVVHFQPSGARVEEIEGSSREDALAKGIARLGENRWELVGENPYGRLTSQTSTPGNDDTGLYFKRSRP